MEPVSVVQSNGRTLAIFVRKGVEVPEGGRFFTHPEDAFQLGLFERPQGYRVEPHQHAACSVQSSHAPEFLLIEHGRAKVTVFDDAWKAVAEEELSSGDMILFLEGGHSVEMLEPTRFFEVKQGPYPGEEKAKIFRNSP